MEKQQWPKELIRFEALKLDLFWKEGVLMKDNKIILPTKLEKRALQIAQRHRGHPGSVMMRRE